MYLGLDTYSDYITPDPPQISLDIDQCLLNLLRKMCALKNILSAEYLLSRSKCAPHWFLTPKIHFLPPPPPTFLGCPRVTSRVDTNAMFI